MQLSLQLTRLSSACSPLRWCAERRAKLLTGQPPTHWLVNLQLTGWSTSNSLVSRGHAPSALLALGQKGALKSWQLWTTTEHLQCGEFTITEVMHRTSGTLSGIYWRTCWSWGFCPQSLCLWSTPACCTDWLPGFLYTWTSSDSVPLMVTTEGGDLVLVKSFLGSPPGQKSS